MSIQSEVSRLQSAKSAIAGAITAKGVTVPETTKLDGYAALVGQIQTGAGGSYTITNQDPRNISVPETAAAGELVFVLNISMGYLIESITVTNQSSAETIPADIVDYKGRFVMPSANVTVKCTFSGGGGAVG